MSTCRQISALNEFTADGQAACKTIHTESGAEGEPALYAHVGIHNRSTS